MNGEKNQQSGMTTIVRTVCRWVVGCIFLFGVYIVLYGHLTPGGGFAGGVIIACAFVLLTLSFGKEVSLTKLSKGVASELDSVGALMFLIIALLGMWTIWGGNSSPILFRNIILVWTFISSVLAVFLYVTLPLA